MADDQISPCKLNMLALANTFYYPSVSSAPAVRPIMTTAGSSSYGERVCFSVTYKLDPHE